MKKQTGAHGSSAPPVEGGHAVVPLSRLALLTAVLMALAVFLVHDSLPASAQQSPPLPSVTDVAADTRRVADAAAVSAAAARDAASAASAIADSHPAAATDAKAAVAAADLSSANSALSRFHADIAEDHTTSGSDRHCHSRVNVCHSHLDSEPYARSAEGARSAAAAHAHAAEAHAAHARAALEEGTVTAETAARVAKDAASADAHADSAAASADAAWDAVHNGDDAQASAGHAVDARGFAAKAAEARAAAALFTQQQTPQTRYADLIAKMKEWRNDPRYVSYKAHTDRWDRVLLTFGETVADTSLSTMTATEAQGYADRGWTRWADVAAALQEIESGGQQVPPPNQAPTVSGAIADATIVNENGARQVSLSGVFSDADSDAMTVSAASSNTAVATVSVASDYSSLTVSAQARGTASITVTADDGNGGAVSDAFTVRVKAAPVVASAIADVSGLEVNVTQEVSLSGVFSDADGDALTITTASSANAIATAVASGSSTLTLTGVAEGTATITVTAQDSDGNRVGDAFDVTVVNELGALITQIKEWRNDPCCASNKVHTDRWDSVLLAFGESVSDTSLTAMTAAEAQTYVDRGWTRWVEVADALQELEAAAADENPPEVGPDLDDPSPDPPSPEPEADTEPPQTEHRSEIVTRYDANSDGAIDVSEYRRAVYDYADSMITYAEFMEVLTAYRLP